MWLQLFQILCLNKGIRRNSDLPVILFSVSVFIVFSFLACRFRQACGKLWAADGQEDAMQFLQHVLTLMQVSLVDA